MRWVRSLRRSFLSVIPSIRSVACHATTTVAAMKLPARSLVKKLVRAHLPPGTRLSKTADLYIVLAFLLYLQRLASEARIAQQIDLSNGLRASRFIARRHLNGARKRVKG